MNDDNNDSKIYCLPLIQAEAAPVRRLLMPVDVASYFRSLLFDIFDVLTISVTADADP
jgi:hypothetical protein